MGVEQRDEMLGSDAPYAQDRERGHLVTPASVAVARPLVEGLRVPTVAEDDRVWELVGVKRTSFDDAIRSALGARERP